MLNKWRVSRHQAATAPANTKMWNYNAKGEVVTANHSTNNAFDRSYEFDGIGNRKKSVDGLDLTDPSATSYTANALNQLEAVGTVARVHDADGNITDNGTHLYTWDAENRLIEIKLKSDSSTVATYSYDYQSRRITKTVGATKTNFVYDGWNPIAVFTGTTLDKTYTWGMDLSGSMQGAGGVGGLLSVNDGSATYYPVYDGNGNVSEYVDSTGAVVAHYEYDAFGQVVASGSKKGDFTHQFSTKQLDSESGLHYYGYRFYDSSNGRWLGRDPIGEVGSWNWVTKQASLINKKRQLEVILRDIDNVLVRMVVQKAEQRAFRFEVSEFAGGLNLYSFLSNEGISQLDVLGLSAASDAAVTAIEGLDQTQTANLKNYLTAAGVVWAVCECFKWKFAELDGIGKLGDKELQALGKIKTAVCNGASDAAKAALGM